MNVLGLDVSLAATGYCFLDEENAKIVESGVVRPVGMNGVVRLGFIESKVLNLVKNHGAKVAAIEGYAFSAHAAYSHELGEACGLIKLALFKGGYSTRIISPSTLKKFVTGKGNAKKNEMLLKVYKRWGVEFADDNEADAYSLARYVLENPL